MSKMINNRRLQQNKNYKIAISGFSGCGNSTISELLGQKLGVPVVNYTFRSLAEDEGKTFKEIQQEAESNPEIDYILDKRQIGKILELDTFVIGSRLACWFDDPKTLSILKIKQAPKFSLKIWLDAPLEVRAARVAKREGRTIEKILRETAKRDKNNNKRYKKLYDINMEAHGDFFRIDVAQKSPSQIVEEILAKLK